MFSIKWPVRMSELGSCKMAHALLLTGLLVRGTVGTILGVDEDATLLHEPGLLSIVGREVNSCQLLLRRLGKNGSGGHVEKKERTAKGNGTIRQQNTALKNARRPKLAEV